MSSMLLGLSLAFTRCQEKTFCPMGLLELMDLIILKSCF
jgi:hypothetical protein